MRGLRRVLAARAASSVSPPSSFALTTTRASKSRGGAHRGASAGAGAGATGGALLGLSVFGLGDRNAAPAPPQRAAVTNSNKGNQQQQQQQQMEQNPGGAEFLAAAETQLSPLQPARGLSDSRVSHTATAHVETFDQILGVRPFKDRPKSFADALFWFQHFHLLRDAADGGKRGVSLHPADALVSSLRFLFRSPESAQASQVSTQISSQQSSPAEACLLIGFCFSRLLADSCFFLSFSFFSAVVFVGAPR
jgi:hypothetical protein